MLSGMFRCLSPHSLRSPAPGKMRAWLRVKTARIQKPQQQRLLFEGGYPVLKVAKRKGLPYPTLISSQIEADADLLIARCSAKRDERSPVRSVSRSVPTGVGAASTSSGRMNLPIPYRICS